MSGGAGLDLDALGFEQGGGWGVGDAPELVVDGPGSIEVLADVDKGLGIAAGAWAGWDVELELAEGDSVVGGDGAGVAEGEDLLEVESLGRAVEGAGVSRGAAEAPIESRGATLGGDSDWRPRGW
jgi:hypothetical protein